MSRLSWLRLFLPCLALATCASVGAKPPFLKVFFETYHIKPESRLGKTRCLICHQPPAPPIRNPYGKQVQMALMEAEARMVTPEILKSIELQDIGDGVKNISKIKDDLPPGVIKAKDDPKPAVKKTVKPKSKVKRVKHKRIRHKPTRKTT